jgi:hypothetical protein
MGNIILLWVLFLFSMCSVVVFLVSIGGVKMVKTKSGSLFMYMIGVILELVFFTWNLWVCQ